MNKYKKNIITTIRGAKKHNIRKIYNLFVYVFILLTAVVAALQTNCDHCYLAQCRECTVYGNRTYAYYIWYIIKPQSKGEKVRG